jgi:hypothetical protein
MAIKKFSAYIEEQAPAQDYVSQKDSDKEATGYQPRAKGEQDFANMHNVQKTDYAIAGQDHIFNGTIVKEEVESEEDEESELSDLTEGKVMDGLENIVKNKSAGTVKFANGKSLKVDMTTANAMLNLYKKINDKNKKKMEDQIEKSPDVFMKLMDLAFGGK